MMNGVSTAVSARAAFFMPAPRRPAYESLEVDILRIRQIQVGHISLPLAHPFKTALRTVEHIDDVVVRVIGENGLEGYGEAPATAVITGETKGSVSCAVRDFIAPAIVGMDLMDLDAVMEKLQRSMVHNTSAKAAVDMALLDLWGKTLNAPLWRLLGGAKREFETDITISVNGVDEMVRDSLEAVERGFHTLKVKVGKDSRTDVERLAAIRAAVGPDAALRVDANQGWSPREAVRIITALEDAGIGAELVEQPVAAGDFDGMKYVTAHVHTPILADESVFSPADAVWVLREHAADYINIKLMKTGGIWPALKLCAIAETFGVQCMIGCMLESQISVAAAAHLAAAKGVITMADLDGPSLCSSEPFPGGPRFDGPVIAMTDDPGVGVAVPADCWDQ